jgi:hypothetical protein
MDHGSTPLCSQNLGVYSIPVIPAKAGIHEVFG